MLCDGANIVLGSRLNTFCCIATIFAVPYFDTQRSGARLVTHVYNRRPQEALEFLSSGKNMQCAFHVSLLRNTFSRASYPAILLRLPS